MLITRPSQLTGINRTMDLNVTEDQINKWKEGACIQDAMPQLTNDEREFIMTGITQEEWDKAFGDNDE